MYDLMIIGSGPAGISAALTAKARNLNFIWFGSRALSTKIEKAEKIILDFLLLQEAKCSLCS